MDALIAMISFFYFALRFLKQIPYLYLMKNVCADSHEGLQLDEGRRCWLARRLQLEMKDVCADLREGCNLNISAAAEVFDVHDAIIPRDWGGQILDYYL